MPLVAFSEQSQWLIHMYSALALARDQGVSACFIFFELECCNKKEQILKQKNLLWSTIQSMTHLILSETQGLLQDPLISAGIRNWISDKVNGEISLAWMNFGHDLELGKTLRKKKLIITSGENVELHLFCGLFFLPLKMSKCFQELCTLLLWTTAVLWRAVKSCLFTSTDAGNISAWGNWTSSTKHVTGAPSKEVTLQLQSWVQKAASATAAMCKAAKAMFAMLCQGALCGWEGFSVTICRKCFDSEQG